MKNDDLQSMIEKYKKELMKLRSEAQTAEEIKEPIETVTEEQSPAEPEASAEQETESVIIPETPENDEQRTTAVNMQDNIPGNDDFPIVPNITPYPYDVNKSEYKDWADFNSKNTHVGYIKIQTFAANDVFPVSNALIVISGEINGVRREFYRVLTNADGMVEKLPLPAPDVELSESPSSQAPYSSYDITASHPNYVTASFKNVKVFDGIESLQSIVLVPGDNSNASVNNENVFDENARG
ncbi:MAG: hypothetical protein K5756_01045 [Clostridiales bacterium]|nr:hypothetical protein [Clostridiales bacterium]